MPRLLELAEEQPERVQQVILRLLEAKRFTVVFSKQEEKDLQKDSVVKSHLTTESSKRPNSI